MVLPTSVRCSRALLTVGLEDIAALRENQKHIKQAVPSIVESVFKKILHYDVTARAFTTRDTRIEDPVDYWLPEMGTQVKHREMVCEAFTVFCCQTADEKGREDLAVVPY